ncbi:MAG TPA: endonuclease/exonuclease/phosphatase family protein [Thermodesulfobacteriota bacterium]
MRTRSWRAQAAAAAVAALLTAACGGAAGDAETPSASGRAPEEEPGRPGDPDSLETFKILHWNVQSGFGKAGWTGGDAGFTPGSNCKSNAWGDGRGPLAEALLATAGHDPSVVAVTLNEAWTCATPRRVRTLLGFAAVAPDTATGEVGGVGIVARHGLAGPPEVVALPRCSDDAEPRHVVRAPVFADAARRRVVQVFATHWTGCTAEAEATVRLMEPYASTPRILAGDLNVKDASAAPVARLAAARYADAWVVRHGAAGGPTATWNSRYGSPRGSLYKRIDYAFSSALAVRSVSRVNASGEPGEAKVADHAGLVVEYAHRDREGSDP